MLAGQFIVTGPSLEVPEVHVLDVFELKAFRDLEALAARRQWHPEEWLPQCFGHGVTHAFRCSESMLEWLVSDDAANLNVAHADQVRAAAARVLLGLPLGGDAPTDDEPGQGARLTTPSRDLPPQGGLEAPIPEALQFT